MKSNKVCRYFRLLIPGLTFLLLLLPNPAFAQADTGTLVGLVRDPAGAVVPGAAVTITNTGTNQVRNVVTDDEGSYTATLLLVGDYRIAVEANGFKRVVQEGVKLSINQSVRVDFSLTVGSISEVVVITTEPPIVQTETATLGVVIDKRKTDELPLNGREFLQLNLLAPGVLPGAEGSQNATQGGAISVNGAREQSNNFMLDGVDNNDLTINQYVVTPSIDAIEEFQLQSSTYSAEFGRSGGGQINIAIKSGTNAFHGSAFEFLRNASLDAKNFFDAPDRKIPQFQRNQFGASLGGPIRKNKTFFFANYEGTRIRQAITRLARVPTLAEKSGDFSRTDINGDGVIDANDVLLNPATGLPFAGNRIPRPNQDQIGAAIAQFFPDPNRADAGQNFLSTPVLKNTIDKMAARVDHHFANGSALLGRYALWKEDRFNPFDPLVDLTNLPGFGSFTKNFGQSLAIGYTHPFSSSLINETRFGFNRLVAEIVQQNVDRDIVGQLGIPGLPRNPRDFGYPGVNVIGYDQLSEPTNLPQIRHDNTFQFIDNISWVRGRHAMKFGVDARRFSLDGFLDVVARGVFVFAPAFTGNSLADLLLGLPVVTVNAVIAEGDFATRTTSYNFFAHDDLKVSPRLTLNVGIRYEYNRPPFDANDRGGVFDFAARSIKTLGTQGVPRSGFEPDRNNFAPRVGFAWRVRGTEDLILRGGYGVFYDVAIINAVSELAFNPPFFTINQFFSEPPNLLRLNNPFPSNALAPGVVAPSSIDRHFREGYMQHWSFGVQKSIGSNLVIEGSYVGSKGTKLLRRRNANAPLPGTDPDINARRPIPQFGDIFLVESSAASNYRSLQVRAEQRFSRGLSFLAAYTWSRSIDDSSALFASRGDINFAQNHYDLRAERSLSNFDVRHRFSMSYIYELPFGRDRKYLKDASPFLNSLVGGWQLTGIVALQTGQPFTPGLSIDNSGTAQFTDRPNLVGNPEIGNAGPDRWFDPGAFAVPTAGTYGNAGRNSLTGPSFETVDLGLFKNFRITDRQQIQFRTEFFNLLNHPNFNLPNRFVDQANAGQISSAKSSRQIQFALKYIF